MNDDVQIQLADFECVCGFRAEVPFDSEDGTITVSAHRRLSVEEMRELAAKAEVGVFHYAD